MSSHKIQCTVGILTLNSGATIKAALESVTDFAEIIVCDGGSTDETLSLARAYGTRVIFQAQEFKVERNKIADFAGVRNQMLAAASYPWFFYLDSDELMTAALAAEMAALISSEHPSAAFWVPRKYQLRGEVVDCAATYPTKQARFFHRDAVTGFIKTIHERIEVKTGMPLLRLRHFMLVPINADPAFHRRKWRHYIELEAVRRGRISFWEWLLTCAENFKISALYGLRYVRNLFFCRGRRLPWRLEWERHAYHVNICRRFWKLVGK
ncbi:MAG: glycosyltransferase [Candidatus Taylorbacteria bacterium]|nr:glycosyltransferase [Candidatus Taylorbacteria bacterium]